MPDSKGQHDTLASAKHLISTVLPSRNHTNEPEKEFSEIKREKSPVKEIKFSNENKEYPCNVDGFLNHISEYMLPATNKKDDHRGMVDKTKMICMVCTDKASGVHYGVLACEGCKVSKCPRCSNHMSCCYFCKDIIINIS